MRYKSKLEVRKQNYQDPKVKNIIPFENVWDEKKEMKSLGSQEALRPFLQQGELQKSSSPAVI